MKTVLKAAGAVVLSLVLSLCGGGKDDEEPCTAERQFTENCEPTPGFGAGELGPNGDQSW